MKQSQSNRLLNYEQAAEFLGMSVPWLRHAVAAGRFPSIKLGRSVRFTEDLLHGALAAAVRPAQDLPEPAAIAKHKARRAAKGGKK